MSTALLFNRPLVELPLALAEVHGRVDTDQVVEIELVNLAENTGAALIDLVFTGAGFTVETLTENATAGVTTVVARRRYELPDHVGAGMRMLLVGLNPSPAAADSGIGFHRPGNRFWPALIAAGLATVDRDPRHLVLEHHIGMTDLVKRTTSRAAELDRSEFQSGLERLDQLVQWLAPRVVCFVGLQGWRAAVDRKALAGPSSHSIAGCATYVMPNPSGLNANHHIEDFVAHFRAAAALGL